MADSHKNFATSLVATAPSPATSGTSLVVTAGQGALFPTVPFNATIWPAGANPLTTNAEIVRVTAISTDTLTITRAQESSSARTVIVGDQIAATVTAKTLTDVEVNDAPLASPTFTGIPAAPTAAVGTNTTQLATTAFAQAIGGDGDVLKIMQAMGSVALAISPGCRYPGAGTYTLLDNNPIANAIYLRTPQTLTGVQFMMNTAGAYTADNENRIGLYSVSAGTYTLVASTANDGNIWKNTAGATVSVPFSSTYAAAAGVYIVVFLYNSSGETTAPKLYTGFSGSGNTGVTGFSMTNSNKQTGAILVESTMPSSIPSTDLIGNGSFITFALY